MAPDKVVAETVGLSADAYTAYAKQMCLKMEENVRQGVGKKISVHWFKKGGGALKVVGDSSGGHRGDLEPPGQSAGSCFESRRAAFGAMFPLHVAWSPFAGEICVFLALSGE